MTAHAKKSEDLFEVAKQYLVAGVSGSARMNAAIGRPLYLTHGDGCRLTDMDGCTYLDYNLSHGATFLGHHGFSAAHSPADIDETLNRVESALGSLKGC